MPEHNMIAMGIKRKLEDEGNSKLKQKKDVNVNCSKKVQKRKLPRDPKSGLPLCRKYMENKTCDRSKCRFAHVERHLRAPCPEFSKWGICSYGDESCFLVHSRTATNPLSLGHEVPHSSEFIKEGEALDINKNPTLKFPTHKNFRFPISFRGVKSDLNETDADENGPISSLRNHAYICIFSVASGFLSRFLSRFAEIYAENSHYNFTHTDEKTQQKFQITPIEAFRGFTKSAANDTIGVVFAPTRQVDMNAKPLESLGHEIMFPLATEVLTSRHSRDEVLFLNNSSFSLSDATQAIYSKWEHYLKNHLKLSSPIDGIVRVKSFPPARKFSHTFAFHFLLSLAKQHKKSQNQNDYKMHYFPVLFPTVDRKSLYQDLENWVCEEKSHNESDISSSPFLHIPSSDIGTQDATLELHIAPYGGHWLWGLHLVSCSEKSKKYSGNASNAIKNDGEMERTKSSLPPQLCSTIRDTYFTKDKAIHDLRVQLGIVEATKNVDIIKEHNEHVKVAPICRAYWKLYEIMMRRTNHFHDLFNYGSNGVKTCTYAIDIGAAPGGWTQFLCDLLPDHRDMKVVAVDPSSLNQKIKDFPNVINIQKRSEDAVLDIQSRSKTFGNNSQASRYENKDDSKKDTFDNVANECVSPFTGFDLLVCDANVSPTQTLELIRPIIPLLKNSSPENSVRAVVTAKNQFSGGKAGADKVHDLFREELIKAKELYVKEGLRIVDVVHLFANSLNETTMIMEMI